MEDMTFLWGFFYILKAWNERVYYVHIYYLAFWKLLTFTFQTSVNSKQMVWVNSYIYIIHAFH